MKKRVSLGVIYGFFIMVMICMIGYVGKNSNQAVKAILFPLSYEGEYSYGDGKWYPIEGTENFRSTKGDLWVRISPCRPLGEEEVLTFYLENIGVGVAINNEDEFLMGPAEEYWPKYMQGNFWYTWKHDGIKQEDKVVIHLINSQIYGNPRAYQNFLDSIYTVNQEVVKLYIEEYTFIYRGMGVFIIVVSIALLGSAVGNRLVGGKESNWLLNMGFMSLFMGIYVLYDTADIFFRQEMIAVNTYIKDFSIIFAAYGLCYAMVCLLKEKRVRWGRIVLNFLTLTDVIVLIISTIGGSVVCTVMPYWAIVQGFVGGILCILGIVELKNKEKVGLLFSGVALSGILVAELVNGYVGLWQCGDVIKVVFTILFVLHIIYAIKFMAINFKEASEAERIRGELTNSKIMLAMSQIKTHFIFNVLNAISGMCGYNPEKAELAIIQFSRYLRSHIQVMERDELQMFQKSLEHLEDYIGLEQLRFGDKIRFHKNIREDNFKIPPLIIQPLVENAIRHGILMKKEGGTISLETYREGGDIVIKIKDDGIGYTVPETEREDAIGLRNVRFRLEYMVNGKMEIRSVPGEGTEVTLTVPTQDA